MVGCLSSFLGGHGVEDGETKNHFFSKTMLGTLSSNEKVEDVFKILDSAAK